MHQKKGKNAKRTKGIVFMVSKVRGAGHLGRLDFQEQENPGFRKPWFSYLMPLFLFTLEVTTGSSLQILDVDFCGEGDTGSGKAKQ